MNVLSLYILFRITIDGTRKAAYARTGISPITGIRHIKRIEAWMGAPVFIGTTQQLSPEGRALARRIKRPFEILQRILEGLPEVPEETQPKRLTYEEWSALQANPTLPSGLR